MKIDRTVIQMTSHEVDMGGLHGQELTPVIYVACADGTMWELMPEKEARWGELPPIPGSGA